MFVAMNHLLGRAVSSSGFGFNDKFYNYLRGNEVENQENGFSLPSHLSAWLWKSAVAQSAVAKFVRFSFSTKIDDASPDGEWLWRSHHPYALRDTSATEDNLPQDSVPAMGIIILESKHYQEAVEDFMLNELWGSLATEIAREIDKQSLWGDDLYWQGILSDSCPNAVSLRALDVYDYIRNSVQALPPQAKFYTTSNTGHYLSRILHAVSSGLFTSLFNVPLQYFDYESPLSQITPRFVSADLSRDFSVVCDPNISIRVFNENGLVSHVFRIKASGKYINTSSVKQYRIIP